MASPRPGSRRGSPALGRVASIVVLALVAGACAAGGTTPPAGTRSTGPVTSPTAARSSAARPSSTVRSSPPAGPSRAPFDPTAVAVTLEPFVAEIAAPLAIVNAADGTDRLFVAEQGGRIRVIRDGALVARPMLDISERISSGGERGLLGVAFHPGYPGDPRVFVDYTDLEGNTVVSSFTVDRSDPDRLDPATESVLLHVNQPFANHNGGAVVFDPAGLLLISLGDGGSGGDPFGNGQDTKTLLAKILRVDVDHPADGRPYGIPADNPFADGSDGRRPEIWLSGLRNPWRVSIDRATGDVWIGDVGQGAWEEIDVQRAGAAPGTNFGWNRMEGRHCYLPEQGCEDPSLVLPVTDYGHDQGCTVIGGSVDRAETPSPLSGGYLFGDYCSGRLWVVDPSVDGPRDPVLVGDTDRSLSAFGEDESGDLYAADIRGGAILRVVGSRR